MSSNKKDQSEIIEIISEAFDSNPSVNHVIRNDAKRKIRIRALSRYALKTSKLRDGYYISSDGTGVALCYKYNIKRESIADYYNQFLLAIKAIGITRVIQVLKREAYIKSHRPASGDYLYFWFFGVSMAGRGKGAAKELKNIIFNKSEEEKLPIYLETSVLKNKFVYERYGFEVYHSWKMDDNGTILWFMKREPNIVS